MFRQLNGNLFLLRPNLRICMDGTSEQDVDLFKRYTFRLRYEEPNVEEEDHVDGTEHVHRIEALVGQEERKYLLQHGIRDILCLCGHCDGLVPHVHAEDLAGPDPSRGAPGRLEEEGEEEHQEDRGDSNGPGLLAVGSAWRLCHHRCSRQHTKCHADRTYEEEEPATETIYDPSCVKCEENAQRAIQGIDELDGGVVREDILINDGAVIVEGALTCQLLSDIEENGEHW